MAFTLPPAPPVPRNKEQQATAFSNASFWSSWYEQLRTIVNEITANIANVITTAQGNVPGGYPVIDANGRINTSIDTVGYIVADSSTTGVILKSPSNIYFRLNVSDTGVLSTTNMGTTKP